MMLLNFTCSNFRSFRDETIFSMLPGSTKNHRSHMLKFGETELLSTSAIFGANASGKSNIYKAMLYSKKFILGAKIDDSSYFRLDPKYKGLPSTFEYEFTIDDVIYRYGFQIVISQRKVVGEWLWRVSDKESVEDTLVFQRPLDNDKFPLNLIKLKYRTSKFLILTLIDELRRNKNLELQELFKVRDWFRNNLVIIGTEDNLLYMMDYSDEECVAIGEFLGSFDVGIHSTGFKMVRDSIIDKEDPLIEGENVVIRQHFITKKESKDSNLEKDKSSPKQGRWALVNNHGNKDELFLWYDESDGTRRLMDLAPIILANTSNMTFIVDELDRSLHPMVVYEFVRRFSTRRAMNSHNQLIFTTHQTCILDQDLLRRDEIWFVQKMWDGHSDIYSLDDYKERFDKNIEKMYLGGRYDAIPKIDREGW